MLRRNPIRIKDKSLESPRKVEVVLSVFIAKGVVITPNSAVKKSAAKNLKGGKESDKTDKCAFVATTSVSL